MQSTKVRKKSLLESYFKNIPLGSELESFCDQSKQSTAFYEHRDLYPFIYSPFRLWVCKDQYHDYSGPYSYFEIGVGTTIRQREVESPLSVDSNLNSGVSTITDDTLDEGYQSSFCLSDKKRSIDSLYSDVDSEKEKGIQYLEYKRITLGVEKYYRTKCDPIHFNLFNKKEKGTTFSESKKGTVKEKSKSPLIGAPQFNFSNPVVNSEKGQHMCELGQKSGILKIEKCYRTKCNPVTSNLDSKKEKDIPLPENKSAVIKIRSNSPTIKISQSGFTSDQPQNRHSIKTSSQGPENKILTSNVISSSTLTLSVNSENYNKRSCLDTVDVITCHQQGQKSTNDKNTVLVTENKDISATSQLLNVHFNSLVTPTTHHSDSSDGSAAVTASCGIKNSTVIVKQSEDLNYTTTKSFSRNKAIILRSVGLKSSEINLSEDSFVVDSKEIVRHNLSPVVLSTKASSQAVLQPNAQLTKRIAKTEHKNQFECKQNTHDVKERFKNKNGEDISLAVVHANKVVNVSHVSNEFASVSPDVDNNILCEVQRAASSKSSYHQSFSNPTQDHDKVRPESGDKENIKECVFGRKQATGAITTIAPSNGCCAMERKVSFNLESSCSTPDISNESAAENSREATQRKREQLKSILNVQKETDTERQVTSKKPVHVDFARRRLLQKTKSLDVKEILQSSVEEETHLTCDDTTIDYRDLEDDLEELTERIDQDLIKYINYEFPGVEALYESMGKQQELDPAIAEQMAGSFDEFLEKQEAMENVRLQKVLLEVEQARSGTVKALLQVNAVLNKVQGENMKLEGDLKSMVQEKDYLRETLIELRKRSEVDEGSAALSTIRTLYSEAANTEEYIIDKQRREELEENMKIFLQSTKREKRDLLQALSKSTNRAESAQRDAEKLRIQFSKVKEQLESSNSTFSKILKHNLRATQRLEEELQSALGEKKILIDTLQNGTVNSKEVEKMKNELQECQTNLHDTLDERDQLNKKIEHLEKQKRDLKGACDELQEQIDHSQDVISKLTDSLDALKLKFDKAVGEKNYLQSCLDETGQLLLHLRNNEQKLREEKGTLEEDLESEMQHRESLQESLRRTASEHQSLVDRLEKMGTTHDTVQETLKEANQKEEYYKKNIDELTKNNGLMHYMLEKEKEEHHDLKELYDNLDVTYRKLRRETTEELMVLRQKVEQLTESNKILTEQNENFSRTSTDLRNSLEQEEEDNISLRKKITWNENHIEKLESEARYLRERMEEAEKELSDIKKKMEDMQRTLKRETEKSGSLSESMDSRENLLNKVSVDLSSARSNVHERDKVISDLKNIIKDKEDTLAELNRRIEVLLKEREDQKARYQETEKECKLSHKACHKYKSEFENLEFAHANLEQERNMLRKSFSELTNDFEMHKIKCNETARRLREQVTSLHSQLLEKDRFAMKQKERYQDTIDNTNSDLALMRQIVDINLFEGPPTDDLRSRTSSVENEFELIQPDIDLDALDVEFIRNLHQQFENEMQSHVDNLEGILHVSRQTNDSVTVVQSPMSKIKLEEIKVLRDETFELRTEVKDVIDKVNSAINEISVFKRKDGSSEDPQKEETFASTPNIEKEIQKLKESIAKIEDRHVSIVRRNSSLLDYARKKMRPSKELVKSNDYSDSEDENSEKFDKEITILTLKEENLKLKAFIKLIGQKINLKDVQIPKRHSSVRKGKRTETTENSSRRSSIDSMSNLSVSPRVSYLSKSARSSPNVEKMYSGRSFSETSSPIPQFRFRPISPASQKYSSADESESSSRLSTRSFRTGSDYLPGSSRQWYKGSASDSGDDVQKLRKYSRHSDGDQVALYTEKSSSNDKNNNYPVRRKSAEWSYDSRSSERKPHIYETNSPSYPYPDTQIKYLREKVSDRYRSGSTTPEERPVSAKTDYKGYSYDSQRSATLPRSRSKHL